MESDFEKLKHCLNVLTELCGKNSHEAILLRSRLTCKNCKESTYQGKTSERAERWVCKHYGEIPKDFNGSCALWVDNVAKRN